ncbi:MAG: stage II sporulation protein E [Firmicutes bacterium HGW-Firmicutes-14]|nr:MAG: stage II sporulation protein E [Firmicutes bacterium HGW-Firmicutes-14]
MSDKTNIYPYHRLSDRKARSRFVWPSFPRESIQNFLRKTLSWETGFLSVISFFAGRAVLSGGLMPFPAAVLSAVMIVLPDKGAWVLLAVIGGLVTVSSGYNMWATVLALVLLFIILGQARGQFRLKWYGVPILVAGLVISLKIGVYAYFAPDLYNYLVAIFEGILAGCAAFLLARTLPVLHKKGNAGALKKEEIIGGAVIIIAFLTGLSELEIYGIELKNVLGRAMVIFAAFAGGSGFGAAMGTLVGIVPSIMADIAPGMVAVYSFSGLMAGMFRSFNRIGICIGFVLGNILLSIYLTDYTQLITAFLETGAAVVLFMFIPSKRLYALRSVVRKSLVRYNSRPAGEKRIKELAAGKIREYARIFRELSRAFGEIACDVRVYEENNLQNLFNGVASKVCKGCSLYRICWDKEFYKTYRNIMDMISHIEVNGRLTEEHISQEVRKRCTRLKELAVTVNCLFETYKQAQMWQRKMSEGRDIIAGQLDGVALIMQNLANEVRIDVRMREDIEAILRSELAKAGYNILDLSVTGDAGDALEVRISCPSCGGRTECVNGIAPLVSGILSQPLSVLNANYCTKKTEEPVCEFRLLPSRAFTVEIGSSGVAKDCSLVSGDSFTTFDLSDNKFAVVLSDGMGVGPRASIESKATITLLEKLMETGFNTELAVKTVNSILVIGSPDETITTVDLAIVDLMNGVVDFVKIGSAPSFIKRSGQVGMIRANSLPIGVLNNLEVGAIQQQIGHDDILVMVSDGLLGLAGDEEEGESWILDVLQNVMTTDPQNIADLLLNKAILRSGGVVEDDMTVVVSRFVSVVKAH